MNKQAKKRYDDEFKASSVKLALESNQPYAQTAWELGIKGNTLYTWIDKFLRQENDFAVALALWSKHQQRLSQSQFDVGQKLGELFVTHMPAWDKLSNDQMNTLWQDVTSDGACWYAAQH